MSEQVKQRYDYPFTLEEAVEAHVEWGANCGPNALAFALQVPLAAVRGNIPGFEEKRYTSPSMMKAALASLAVPFTTFPAGPSCKGIHLGSGRMALVRIQWEGPWTAPGANPKWAYRQTHWIATWREWFDAVFDVNGGVRTLAAWEKEIVPKIVASIPRATGGWFPTDIWRIDGR